MTGLFRAPLRLVALDGVRVAPPPIPAPPRQAAALPGDAAPPAVTPGNGTPGNGALASEILANGPPGDAPLPPPDRAEDRNPLARPLRAPRDALYAAGGAAAAPRAAAACPLPRALEDGAPLGPRLALHHDGDPEAVRLVGVDAAGWVLEIAEPGASYVSFAFSPDPAAVAPGPGRIWRARAALALSPLPGAAPVEGAERGWMRLNAARPGRRPRAAVRDAGFGAAATVRGFDPAALGVAADGPPPEALWLDVILAAPRGLRVALRGIWLESALRPGV